MVSPPPEQGGSPPGAPSAPPPGKSADETIKETFESIVVAFILAFVFRAFVVEAFVIPTGSMAPTLLGQHVRVTDEQSGYIFNVDAGGPAELRRERAAISPMTRFPNVLPQGTLTYAGDRILVQKYIYMISPPRRWDVVVFKNPQARNDDGTPGPSTNYIKRLIGLPDEQIALLDGNVYVKPIGAERFVIARKTDRPKTQRAVFRPIYHSQFIPVDGGRMSEARRYGGVRYTWATPWVAQGEAADAWRIEGRRSYAYDSDRPGRIAFEFRRGRFHTPDMMYPYNQFRSANQVQTIEPIEDVRLAVTVQPLGPGAEVTLSTTTRFDDLNGAVERISAGIDAAGRVTLQATNLERRDAPRDLQPPRQWTPLEPGRNTTIELWCVDQQAMVWIDGRLVLERGYEMSLDQLRARGAPANLPAVEIQVGGGPMVLHNVELDRDLYYAATSRIEIDRATGGLERIGARVLGDPLRIGADEYFCVGDNGPMSHDGRFWGANDPWVRHRYFPYAPDSYGLVPGELLVGRAFFVYFPAPFRYAPNAIGVFPNFGDMRFIH